MVGPSGSGKSTALGVISGLMRPDSGSVLFDNIDIWKMNDVELERFRLINCSYIFQHHNLFPALTAIENVEIILRWGFGVNKSDARIKSEQILDELNLLHRANTRPIDLSGGEKQRVAIARAMVKNPKFIFADEPTSALDAENGQIAIELLKEQAYKGATVVVVTHDERLYKHADRIFKIENGKIKKDGPEI